MTAPDSYSVLLSHIGKLEGQLVLMTQLMQQHHESTHRRIDDFRQAMDGRITSAEARVDRVEKRLEQVEVKERSTAIKAAGGGAITAAMVELIKFIAGH